MKFSPFHLFAKLEGEIATCGLLPSAIKELGEVVYVELPKVGAKVIAGQEVAVIESTKAATDIYSPLSGNIVEINSLLQQHPQSISNEKEGWIFKLKLINVSEYQKMMDECAYQEFLN